MLWRGLTQQRDAKVEWKTATRSFSFSDLLAEHVKASLGEGIQPSDVVLTIPNAFSNYAQQKLLDSCRRIGLRGIKLLWTPIAIALRWIEAVEQQRENLEDGGKLLIIYVGDSTIDADLLELRREHHLAGTFTVPVRKQGRVIAPVGGFDLAATGVWNAAQTRNLRPSAADLWYAMSLPSLWADEFDETADIFDFRLWHCGGGWSGLPDSLLQEGLTPQQRLTLDSPTERIARVSGAPGRQVRAETWRELLIECIEETIPDHDTTILGAIVGGLPFAIGDQEWMGLVEQALDGYLQGPARDGPTVGRIWNLGDGAREIAHGAAIFGSRLKRGLPTYLDTLPDLEVYALAQGEASWNSIVRERTVEGGQIYRDRIQGEFALHKGDTELQTFLRLDDGDECAIKKASFVFPRGPNRTMPIDLQVELKPVGGLAVVEMLPEDPRFLGDIHVYLDYDMMEEVEDVPEVELGWPPTEEGHAVSGDDEVLFYDDVTKAIEDFLDADVGSSNYLIAVRGLADKLAQRKKFVDKGEFLGQTLRIVDVNGRAATPKGQAIIDKVSEKLASDFEGLQRGNRGDSDEQKALALVLKASTWLFAGANDVIRSHVRERLTDPLPGNSKVIVNAAGRSFVSEDDMRAFFTCMVDEAWRRHESEVLRYFIIDWLWASHRLLSMRERAPWCLERAQVEDLYRFLYYDLSSWIDLDQPNGFVATLRLLLYLLRYRQVEPRLMAEGNSADGELRAELLDALEDARDSVESGAMTLRSGARRAAIAAISGVVDFLDYRGSISIIQRLDQVDSNRS
ncbi:MAG: hypothetical protein ACX98W_05210 [bacterium]